MTFREICDLFGGQSATARILGLKTCRYVRRCVAKNEYPKWWDAVLKREAKIRSIKLAEFAENESVVIDLTEDK